MKIKKQKNKIKKEFAELLKKMKDILKNKIDDVRVSKRLTNSPSCIVVNDYGMSMHLQKMMSDTGQMIPGAHGGGKPILEINPSHILIKQLNSEKNGISFKDWTNILYQQAMLAEGAQLEDPSGFINLLNKYLVQNIISVQ